MRITLGFLTIAIFLIAPWGNFPLNDDWQFARVALKFLQSHKIIIDTPIAPSIVIQTLFAYPFLHILGFSHLLLRGITFFVALALLYLLNLLLKLTGAGRFVRTLSLLTVAFNPLFLFSSLTYMSEIYGYLFCLLSAYFWFYRRDGDTVPLSTYFIVALISGISFWQRQYCVLVFPSLVLAHYFSYKNINLKHLLLSTLLFLFAISLYFLWARISNNYNSSFQSPLAHMFQFHLKYWLMYPGIFLIYLTCFAAPLLVFYPARITQLKQVWPYGLGALSFYYIFTQGYAGFLPRHSLYRDFPFLGNVIYNAGVGPITLTDVYHQGLAGHPSWPSYFWKFGLALLLVILPSWSRVFSPTQPKLKELQRFGIYFAIIPLSISIQAYGLEVMDRYLFPALLSLPLVIAISFPQSQFSKRQVAIGLMVFSCLAFFSVCGLHDYFRWNEVRWKLYSDAIAQGGSKTHISGGNEINGWNHYDEFISSPSACVYEDWFCIDDTYRISMNELPNYQIVKSQRPSYWLTQGPPLYLLKKVNPL